MKKVHLTKVTQKNKEFFVMVLDPRIMIELLERVKPGTSQEAQRPWVVPKVKEISRYVAGKIKISDDYKAMGLIPNAPILSITKKLKIEKETVSFLEKGSTVKRDNYFIMIPEEFEYEKYLDSFVTIDGQHRIRGFDKEYRDPLFENSIEYEMVFCIFEELTKNERRELFWVTNAKQDKVTSNLLRLIKNYLGLLGTSELVFDVCNLLNDEDISPLKGRIMIGSEKVTKGYKEAQLSKVLEKSQVFSTLNSLTKGDSELICKVYSSYLKSWENVYKVSFESPDNTPLTKISGIRYITFIMPSVIRILQSKKLQFTTKSFQEIIKHLDEVVGTNVFEDDNVSLAFRGEGATVKMAKDHGTSLEAYHSTLGSDYNPLEGI
ncbi:DGQHR domain-containing protein [Psychrobacter sp. ASPA161_9]|uniref:DGQHR domain-containing protein n=1 Tax=Psychrobacter sp. ASPA161_9 TaxID=3160961 RepID=UPI003F80C0E0